MRPQEMSWYSLEFYLYAKTNRVWLLSLDMVRDSVKDNLHNSDHSTEIAHVGTIA